MQHQSGPAQHHRRLPWYLWPLVPPVAIVTFTVVGIPLSILALFSIPYFWLYPDRHMHIADVQGTLTDKERVAKWRAAHRRLSFFQRVRHSQRRFARRRGAA
jgi:hypothetical protein